MRKALIAGLTVALAGSMAVQAQEPPPLEAADIGPGTVAPLPDPEIGPQPGDVAPAPPPAAPKEDAKKKVKIAETAGGAVGGALAKTAGTAVGGPVAGFAAGVVGHSVGRGAVSLVKRLFGLGDKDDDASQGATEQARAAPGAATDISATLPAPEPDPPALAQGRSPPPAGPQPD